MAPHPLTAPEVFTPNAYPRHTYVKREEAVGERLLGEWARSSTQIASVSGPSKAGKTVLVQRVIGEGNLITVSGASVRAPDQLWERVLDWCGEPHASVASTVVGETSSKTHERGGTLGLPGAGATVKGGTAAGSTVSETTQITANRRGLPQVVGELANTQYALLVDDFHYIPAAIQGDVAQQLKDAASRGVRIAAASVPHRADNVVRVLPELRGRVLAIDLDYWSKADLLEIPRLGCAALNVTVDKPSLARFAEEAAGSPQLMQSICQWMCNHMGIRETEVGPAPREIAIDANQRKEILYLASLTAEYRSVVRALRSGPKARPDQRRTYQHADGRKGDVYLTVIRALAMDPPRLTLTYSELGDRLDQLCGADAPEGASIVRTLGHLDSIAKGFADPYGPALEWDEKAQIVAIPDPYLLFYLRCSGMLEKEAEAEPDPAPGT